MNSQKIEHQNFPLIDFVQVYKKALTTTQCQSILNKESSMKWDIHLWVNYDKILPDFNKKTEFDRAPITGLNKLMILNCISEKTSMYIKHVSEKLGVSFDINGISPPALNRYNTGTEMLPHVDHIHYLFDGKSKGIPVLSIVGLLNDDFTEGRFVFWDKYDIDMEAGDIVIFPSNFLYKHRVTPVTQGIRYSFVSWAF